jgi:putative transcriptional regulator
MKKSILEVVHESAKDLHKIGLMDSKTLRKFDTICLPPVRKLSPTEIKRIHLREKVSQPIFAECLNATSSAVKKWETGETHPTGPTLKLLNLVAEKGLVALF